MLPLGTAAPDFSLLNPVTGETVSLANFKGAPGLVVMFICNHCPYVKHLRSAIADFGRECQEKGVAVVAISSNDVANYPDDSPELMVTEAKDAGYVFPYLYDESQEAALNYRAACTPDFYLFDKDFKLVYRGQFDDSRPRNDVPVTGKDLRGAVDALIAGSAQAEEQIPSLGCNIKWKPGGEPDYFKLI